MKNYFEEKLTVNQVTFCYTKKVAIDEREIHPYHEMLYYMDGGATVLSETFRERLNGETLFLIPKEHYHYFELDEPENFERLKISFPDLPGLDGLTDEVMSELRIIKEIPKTVHEMLRRICGTMNGMSEVSRVSSETFIYGAFLTLLGEIGMGKITAVEPSRRESGHLISQCVRYIETHLAGDVGVSALARAMQVSESTISRIFRHDLGITLHRYVTEKRLIFARRLIMSGENPTKIFLECGYGDYSSFYKAYVRMFGHSPSVDRNE